MRTGSYDYSYPRHLDTHIGYRPTLECPRADVAESVVLPGRAVERLDVFEHLPSNGLSRCKSFAVDSLNLHGMEEVLLPPTDGHPSKRVFFALEGPDAKRTEGAVKGRKGTPAPNPSLAMFRTSHLVNLD